MKGQNLTRDSVRHHDHVVLKMSAKTRDFIDTNFFLARIVQS